MKKWIPKDTPYCETYKHGKRVDCKWLSFNPNKHHQEAGFCRYLKTGDWIDDGTWLLWDGVKECEID